MIIIGGSGGETKLTDEQRRILDYAEKHGDGAKIALGVNGAAGSVAPYIMESDAVVIGMGGFGGRDNTPSVDQLQQWVNDGTLRFILSSPSGGRNEPVVREGPGGMMGAAAQERQRWIEQHCTVVEPSAYGGKSSANIGSRGGPDTGQTRIGGDAEALYRCGGG